MPWGKLDDSLYDHRKLVRLGRDKLACVGLRDLAISWSNRHLTDGAIPADVIRQLGGTTRLAELLVSADLFERLPDGYQVHDFLDFNHSKAEVLAQRDAATERKRKSRASSQRDPAPVPPVSQRDAPPGHTPPPARVSRPDPTRPDPTIPTGDAAPAPVAKPNGHGPLAGIVAGIAANLGQPTPTFGVGDDEAKVFAYLARNGAAIRPDSGLGRRLLGLIDRRGYEVVLEEAARLPRSGPLSDRQWVFGLEEVLEKPPSAADSKAQDREEDRQRRSVRIAADMAARRLEAFRFTGKWPADAGPEPAWNPAWGSRP